MSDTKLPSAETAPPTANRVYVGTRCAHGNPRVTVNGRTLDPRPSQKVHNHSPNGFEWGYGGSGPAQLALAILLDATDGNKLTAEEWHQQFKWDHVTRWHQNGWATTRAAVLRWLSEKLCPFPRPADDAEGGGG